MYRSGDEIDGMQTKYQETDDQQGSKRASMALSCSGTESSTRSYKGKQEAQEWQDQKEAWGKEAWGIV